MGVLGGPAGLHVAVGRRSADALGSQLGSWAVSAEQQPSGFAGNKASTVPSQLRARRAVPSRQSGAPPRQRCGRPVVPGACRERGGSWRVRWAAGTCPRRPEPGLPFGAAAPLGAHHLATGSESQREVGELLALSTSRGFPCSLNFASQVPGVL